MREEMKSIYQGFKIIGRIVTINRCFGFTVNEIDEIVNDDIEESKLIEQYERDWMGKMLSSRERKEVFADEIDAEKSKELRRNYLLLRLENLFREYYESGDKIYLQRLINSTRKEYEILTYRPDDILQPDEIDAARNIKMSKLLEVNKAGFASCPFHKEKNPSFKIYENKYYCFGCGEKGDSISFVMKQNNLKFKEAIKYLLKI